MLNVYEFSLVHMAYILNEYEYYFIQMDVDVNVN